VSFREELTFWEDGREGSNVFSFLFFHSVLFVGKYGMRIVEINPGFDRSERAVKRKK